MTPAIESHLEGRPSIEKRCVIILRVAASAIVIGGGAVYFIEVRKAQTDARVKPRPDRRSTTAPRQKADIDNLSAGVRLQSSAALEIKPTGGYGVPGVIRVRR